MNIIELDIGLLKPYELNAKKHDEQQIKNVAESITQFGWRQPIVVDKDNVIIIGHCRYEAAKLLKLEKVPCQIADDLTEEQVKKLRVIDNKTNESDWDLDLLFSDIENLNFDGFDIDFGFPEEPLEVKDDEFDIDAFIPEEPVAKLGDIYQLGEHRLMCGDSTKQEDVEKIIDGIKVDLVYTDPPYGMNAVSKSGVLFEHYKNDILNDDDNTVAIKSFNLVNQMFKDVKQVWWGGDYYTECLPSAECWLVWDKNNGASDQTDCELAWTNFRSVVRQFTMASEKTNRFHPTQKPIKLFVDIINKFEKNKKFNIVLDLFGGSGSTLIACEQLNRKCYMMELDPKYVDVIIARWEQFTGKKAVKLN